MSSSSNPSEFIRLVEAMFDEVKDQIEDIARVWQIKVIAKLVIETPGPGNQYELTEYIATGRLRAGWSYSMNSAPPQTVSRMAGGPFDWTGGSTNARIAATIMAAPLPRKAWAWNNVAYGYWVHEGLEGHAHIGPRKWVDRTALAGQRLLDEARADVMGRKG